MSNGYIFSLLLDNPVSEDTLSKLSMEQKKDLSLQEIFEYLEQEKLPNDVRRAQKIVAQAPSFVIAEDILYFIDSNRGNRKRAVTPQSLKKQIMMEGHGGRLGGHFSGQRTYNSLAYHWWWKKMYSDIIEFCKNCPECAIVSGHGRRNKPPLYLIPVQRPFQIVGVDVMDLPKTLQGNQHVIVFQDMFTKWPLVFAIPDQKTERVARLLVDEIIPFFGVPESLLSDRGTNLLSHLMNDVCQLLGITKLNTTAYHPQCDEMVERFNRTLKAMIRKYAAQFDDQWDRYLPGLLWAYRNTPHESTGEKPSYLLFGIDCRTPTEAALLPPSHIEPTELSSYREEMILSLSAARNAAAKRIQKSQKKNKDYYDRRATHTSYRLGDWILIRFPAEETGARRKLSRPWHGPYRVKSKNGPDVTATKVYFPTESQIQVHMSRTCACPTGFPAGYYWYGSKRKGPGRPPKWVEELMNNDCPDPQAEKADKKR